MMKLLGPQATFHIVVLTVRRTDFAQIASKAQVENETFLTQPVTPSLPYQKQVPQSTLDLVALLIVMLVPGSHLQL